MLNCYELTSLISLQSIIQDHNSSGRKARNLVLVVIDLDHLLPSDEENGHQAGDEWLKGSAEAFERDFADAAALPGRDLDEVLRKFGAGTD